MTLPLPSRSPLRRERTDSYMVDLARASVLQPASALHASAGSGELLGVDWASIGLVFVVALVATVVVVTFFALGLRLLAVGSANDDEPGTGAAAATTRPLTVTIAAWACITIGAAGVLYGIYLVIPQFH